jgi:hypothetical protein
MAQPGTPILSDWVEIKNTVNLGDVMRQFAAINVEEIGNPVTYSMKGTENFPNFAVTLNRNNTDPGQIALKAAASSREVLYNFRVEDPDGGLAATGTFTVTIASPGVFTAVSPATHGLNIGDRVKLSTTGALPTGLVAGTTYYVIAAGFTTSAFQLSTTAGGAAIVTTGTQSGTHTYTEIPLGSTKDWKGEVFGFGTGYGGPNNLRQVKTEISFRPETFVETLAP